MTRLSGTAPKVPADCACRDDDPSGINVVLVGGPGDFLETARFRRAGQADEKVKVLHKSGYEHFERTMEHYRLEGGCQGLIFRWTTRTMIAE
jgi:hypothetical protein